MRPPRMSLVTRRLQGMQVRLLSRIDSWTRRCFFRMLLRQLSWAGALPETVMLQLQVRLAAAKACLGVRARRACQRPVRQRSGRSRAGAKRSGLRWGRCQALGMKRTRAMMRA